MTSQHILVTLVLLSGKYPVLVVCLLICYIEWVLILNICIIFRQNTQSIHYKIPFTGGSIPKTVRLFGLAHAVVWLFLCSHLLSYIVSVYR